MVVSIDYVKAENRIEQFVRGCPELVIVDEAHGVARPGRPGAATQQQRHELVRRLAADPKRHVILATATPDQAVASGSTMMLSRATRTSSQSSTRPTMIVMTGPMSAVGRPSASRRRRPRSTAIGTSDTISAPNRSPSPSSATPRTGPTRSRSPFF